MKKIYLSLLAIAITSSGYAQWTTSGTNINNTNTGNVGIGTTSPQALLHLAKNQAGNTYQYITNSNVSGIAGVLVGQYTIDGQYGTLAYTGSSFTDDGAFKKNTTLLTGQHTGGLSMITSNPGGSIKMYTGGYADNNERMRITADGNVGIGTTTPTTLLDVVRPATSGSAMRIGTMFDSGQALDIKVMRGAPTTGYYSLDMSSSVYSWQKLVIPVGNVGIGTTNPTEKLSVNGKIRAQEIKVEASPWPDYVFKPSYKLPDLKETEKFIKENKHLPGIPSAKEVEKEGINLGEMNARLLQKIEELTLYLIEKDKELIEQKKETDLVKQQQDSRILALETKLEKLALEIKQ